MHWGSYVEVTHSYSISCSNSSLRKCSPVTQVTWVRFPAEIGCSSREWRRPWSSLSIMPWIKFLFILLSVVFSWTNGIRTFCSWILSYAVPCFSNRTCFKRAYSMYFLCSVFNKDSYIIRTLLYISLYGRSMTNSSHTPFFCLSAWVSIFLFVLWGSKKWMMKIPGCRNSFQFYLAARTLEFYGIFCDWIKGTVRPD
jgi:hypothetical protein